MRNIHLFFSCLILVVTVFYIWKIHSPGFSSPLGWDEADYATAAKEGLLRNALGTGELSLVEFSQLGYAKFRHQKPPSGLPDEKKDIFLLRHFHPPLPVYYFSFFTASSSWDTARLLRISNFILNLLFVIAVLGCALYSSEEKKVESFISPYYLLPVLLLSGLCTGVFSSLNFHSFHGVATILFTTALSRFVAAPGKRNAVISGFSSALLFLTLETGVVVFASGLLFAFLLSGKKILFLKEIKYFIVTLLIALVILWPGIIITGGPLKSWAMYFYRIFSKENAEYSGFSLADTYLSVFSENKSLLIFLALAWCIALFQFIVARQKPAAVILLPLATGTVYLIFISPFLLGPSYLFPAVSLLFMGGTLMMIHLSGQYPRLIFLYLLLGVGTIFMSFRSYQNRVSAYDSGGQAFKSDMAFIESLYGSVSDHKKILMDGGHIMRFYSAGKNAENRVEDLFPLSYDKPQFAIRAEYEYRSVEDSIKNYKAIVLIKELNFRNLSREQHDWLISLGYKYRELNFYKVYYQ